MFRFKHLPSLIVSGFILVCVSVSFAAQTGTVSVQVLDPKGNPVPDARVLLVETKQSAYVDEQGRASFNEVPEGDYHLEVTSHRFGSFVLEFSLAEGQDFETNVDLTRAMHQERIVVTATTGGRGSAELVVPVNVLDEEELTERMQPTLGETLSQELGVNSTSFSTGASRPIIRGQSGGRVRILESGIGVGDASTSSPDHAVTIDPLTAKSIEVVRGPAALIYDSSAIGGLVNVLDNRIPTHAPKGKLNGALQTRLSSGTEETSAALDLNGGNESFAWHLDTSIRDMGDYDLAGPAVRGDEDSPSDELPNSGAESQSLTLGGSWLMDNGYIGVSARGFNSDYGIQEIELKPMDAPAGPPEPEEEGVRIDMEQRRFDLRGGFQYDDGFISDLNFSLGVTDYEHAEFEGGEVGTQFFNETSEARVEISHQEGKRNKGTLGFQWTDRNAEAVGEEAFLPEVNTESYALFALQEFNQGPIRYELGGRFESTDVGVGFVSSEYSARALEANCTAPISRETKALSASLGAIWLTDNGYGLGASLTRAVRSPAAEELYSCGPHLATQSFEVGNAGLSKETGIALDVNLRKRSGRITGELNVFLHEFDDYIYEQYTNVIRTEEGEEFDTYATTPAEVVLPEFRFTQEDAEFYGAEVRVLYELFEDQSRHIGLEFTGDIVRAELADTGEPLPRIPAARTALGLHYRGEKWFGSTTLRYVDSQTRLSDSEIIVDPTTNGVEGLDLLGGATDSYHWLQMMVGYRKVKEQILHEFTLRGSNLTDENARVHTSRLKNVAPLPGADIHFTYRLLF